LKIEKSELDGRRQALQLKLEQQNIGGAIVALNTSMYYFSGTIQCQYIYIPAKGECLGLVRKNMARARLETDIPLAFIKGFSDIPHQLEGFGYHKPKILGMELDVLPTALYMRFQKLFSKSEIIDVSVSVREVRQPKSAYELDQIKEAARQVDCMHRCVPSLLVEGKEEIVLASELEAVLRREGHQGVGRMRGFNQEITYGHLVSGKAGALASYVDSPNGGEGLTPAQPQGAGRKKIRSGEPVLVDYGGIFNGYIVDQSRLFSIGPLPEILLKAYTVALEIQEKIRELLVPGISGDTIYQTALALAKKADLADYFMGFGDSRVKFVGHGVGLEFNEYPILAKGSRHCLDENYVVAVEPKFIFPDLGVAGIENTWLIQSIKPKKISLTPDDLVIV